MNADSDYRDCLRRHIDDPRRMRDVDGGYTSVDHTHRPIRWDAPSWAPTGPTVGVRPGTPCEEFASHCLVAGVCADCGLETN